jgi:hypothetical protein
MLIENFTQFCCRNGYPSDYDVLEHADLSPSGHCSKRDKVHRMNRMETRMSLNKLAHREYEAAIYQGNIVDPSKEYTIEEMNQRQVEIQNRINSGRIAQLERHISDLQCVGIGKLGKIKPSYQRQIEECQKELATIR